jgi:hypothetical protein
MAIYKDFVGLNYGVYDPNSEDPTVDGINHIGYNLNNLNLYFDQNLPAPVLHDSHQTISLLNIHRNGPYGYPTWKQIRTSDNHLTRYQRKSNIFTYVEEHDGRFGETRSFIEPVIVDSYKPVSLIGEVKVYNDKTNEFQNRSVELKTSFGNETAFFANSKVNDYFETIAETDDNYEQLKELYLDGGLEDEGSPIDSFNMFVYRQSIYPKQQYAYLDETRSRKYYVNTYWRDSREDRIQDNVDNGFGETIPFQSMWPLDSESDFESKTYAASTNVFDGVKFEFDIGGSLDKLGNATTNNSLNAPGILQNRHSTFTLGGYYAASAPQLSTLAPGEPSLTTPVTGSGNISLDVGSVLTASCEYSRLHTLKNLFSVVNPSGPKLDSNEMLLDRVQFAPTWPSMQTGSIFNGTAHWDAPAQANKKPFYDSYADFSEDTRLVGKSFSKIPEFKISSHVETYITKGITEELASIFELSGAFDANTNTDNSDYFYEILSTSDFLKHFDLVKNDHKDLSREKIITLKCKAIKKFLPYEGFYPAQRTVEISQQFSSSYGKYIKNSATKNGWTISNYDQFGIKPLLTPIAAPGILFNTIKSGVAVDFPLILSKDILQNGDFEGSFDYRDDIGHRYLGEIFEEDVQVNNYVIESSNRASTVNELRSVFSERIPFEALVEPERFLANKGTCLQEPHPFGLGKVVFDSIWDGQGDALFKKMSSNFLAEVPDFFIENENFKTISSLEEQNPEFGNAVAGNYYLMRIKMTKSRERPNYTLGGFDGFQVVPPQDIVSQDVDFDGTSSESRFNASRNESIRETLTMYSRPTAFGPPTAGSFGTLSWNGINYWMGSEWGYNFPYTPPYYHGESWCDLIFYARQTKKYTLDEILSQVQEYPYFTRYWHPSFHDALRDLTGYSGSTSIDPKSKYYNYDSSKWKDLISSGIYSEISTRQPNGYDSWADPTNDVNENVPSWTEALFTDGPQAPTRLNYNAMQLDSSVNLFGKGTIKTKSTNVSGQDAKIEVASSDTVAGKTRWIIQPKFETPILNFNKYTNLDENNCTSPQVAKSQVPRGMWHQYGDLPAKDEGIYLQVEDIPKFWLRGALGIDRGDPRIKSLADLVGFSKDKVRLGEVAEVKEISEAVVAVPFIEKDGTRQFFSIPREDIDSCIGATKREVEPGTFVAGGPPKAGDSVYQMVKKMQKYVFPPSMDFVKYKEIDPFAMYIFEFKHNLTKQDLADIWQNLPPEIGTKMEEAEATISHELLAHELLGGGSVVNNGVLDDNAEGNGIPSNIQWMIFKAKKRAKTNYFDKVVAKKGTTADTSSEQLENAQGQTGDDLGITYNWPYDFFSLVELVKIDAEVTFANIENDDKGQKTIKKVEKKSPVEMKKSRIATKGINLARGKGKFKK